jgi:hypothetical protein
MSLKHNVPIVSLDDLPNIKRQYTKAVKAGKTEFKCWLTCGQQVDIVTSYAKYLIEFLTEAKNDQSNHTHKKNV